MREENPAHPVLAELYRRATPAAKLAAVARINSTLVSLKAAHLTAVWPQWSEAERQAELRRWWFSARD